MVATLESAFATISDWCALSGMRTSRVYDELSRGNLRGKKVGKRVLIDVPHGIAWLRSQPDAEIRLKRAPRHILAAAGQETAAQ